MDMMMKKWKRGLAFVMAVVMTLGLLTVGASAAEGDEAQIGDQTYETLDKAIAEANNGDTIILLNNAYRRTAEAIEKDLIFDLNGYELNVSGSFMWYGDRTITIRNGTLSGSGTIIRMEWNGTLRLEKLRSGSNAAFSFLLGGGSVVLSDCIFTCSSDPILMISGATVSVQDGSELTLSRVNATGVAFLTKGELNVEDANITGVGPAICISDSGHNATVALNNGAEINTTSGDGSAIQADAGTVEINEGASLGTLSSTPISGGGKVILPTGGTLEYQNGKYVLSDCSHGELGDSKFTPPTCTEAGKYVAICKKCGAEVVERTGSALGHDFGEWNITREANCTENGEKVHTCTRDGCDVKETEVIEATGHTWGDWTVTKPASCTETGVETRSCSKCTATETRPIDAKGHTWGDWTVTKPASCTETGVETRSCSKCTATETRPIDAKGHTEAVDAAVEATCTATGLTAGKHCSVCGEVLVARETVPAKGHTEAVDAAVEATCTATGLTAGKHCSVCNTVLVAQETVPAKGHTENGGVVTTEPTSTTNGTRTFSCTVCGQVIRTETIPATGGGSTGGGSTGGGSTGGGSTGGGSTGGGSTGGGSTGGGSTGGGTTGGTENLPDNNTPQTEAPEDGEELGNTDVPLVSKPFLFEDVGEKRWFYPAVKYVFDRGLMDGRSDTLFDPMANTTRGMVVTVLYRMEEEPSPVGQVDTFTDLKAGQWYTNAVLWAADNGIVNGYSTGAFGPQDDVTREQLVVILYRYAQYKGLDVSVRGDLSAFGDKDRVAKYAREAMEWAVGAKLISGVTATALEPKGNATRAQIATVLMNFDRLVTESAQADGQGE